MVDVLVVCVCIVFEFFVECYLDVELVIVVVGGVVVN